MGAVSRSSGGRENRDPSIYQALLLSPGGQQESAPHRDQIRVLSPQSPLIYELRGRVELQGLVSKTQIFHLKATSRREELWLR